jgi:hypothetical protein
VSPRSSTDLARRFSIPDWRASIQAYRVEPFQAYQSFGVKTLLAAKEQGQNLPAFRTGQTGSKRS